MPEDRKIILLLGSLHQGFVAFGPYDSREEAAKFRKQRTEWPADYLELVPPPKEDDDA